MPEIILVGEQIRKNKAKTVLLISVFIVLILIVSSAIGYYIENIPLAVIGGVVFAAGYTWINLGIAKITIMKNVKGKKVTAGTHPELVNQVHGLAIAAGIPMPEVYVVPTQVPNAFATGLSPQSSAIGVTQGLLELLDRQELEGVIAHEISHIRNYDIRVTCVALSLGMVFIALSSILFDIVRFGSRGRSKSSRSDSKNGNNIMIIIMVVAFVLAVFSRFISPIIQMAISRKREYIADADAVRISSTNEGLISALKKMRDYSPNAYSKNQVKELGGRDMLGAYIVNPFKGLWSTHPDINERIQILERSF